MKQTTTRNGGSIVFVLILCLSFLLSTNVRAQVSAEERQALVDFYNATNGDNWKNTLEGNRPWQINDPNSQVTDWYGVYVTNGKVVQLDMFKNNLTGVLPPSLGTFTDMNKLVLSGNDIGGELPDSLIHLTKLQAIHLSNNEFTGAIPILKLLNASKITYLYFDGNNFSGPIPPEIGQLSNLVYVSLSYNELSGNIPVEITQLPNLVTLYFSGNRLTGNIPPEFGQMPKLTRLSFTNNNLSGVIPPELGNAIKLGALSFAGNQLTGSIPPQLGQLTNLYSLSFNGNQLTGSIPRELGQLVNVIRLYFYDNQLTGSIPAEFGQLAKLENLQLGKNQLTGSLPAELGLLPVIKRISLDGNQLSGSFPPELGQLSTLEHAHFHNNEFTGAIPETFGQLINLKALYVYGNNLSGSVPVSISALPNLTAFGISGNKFVFSDFESNFTAFNNISSFTYNQQQKADIEETLDVTVGETITLTSNAFNSPNNSYQWYKNNAVIPGATSKEYVISNAAEADAAKYKVLATNSVVSGLNIYRNDITLTVSPANNVCNVSETERQALVDLYNTTNGANWTNTWDLTKPVCEWYGVAVEEGKVKSVDLRSNNLTGSLSSTVGNLLNLSYLNLNYNNINGDIPNTLGSLLELSVLYLRGNNFSGTIPNTLGSLTKLQYLFLDINNLSGTIPVELGQLANLTILNLRDNKLNGNIPVSLSTLSKLRDLNVSKNELSGNLPSELGQLVNLEAFYISDNQFTGDIPAQFVNLVSFNNFWIGENNFVFSNLEQSFADYTTKLGANFKFSPQSKVDSIQSLSVEVGNSITLSSVDLTSVNNTYQWYKDGVAIAGATNKDLVINNAADTDAGIYHFTATNSVVTTLTLERNTITLNVTPATNVCAAVPTADEQYALEQFYNVTGGANWTNNTNWLTSAPICDWYGVTVVNDKIVGLELSNNNLVGDVSTVVFDFLSNLETFNVQENNLSGSLSDLILRKLKVLNVSNNNFSGSLNFGRQLNNLTYLNASNNSFSGEVILENIGENLSSLTYLNLSSNEFSGLLPEDMYLLSAIETFDVSNNNFEGVISLQEFASFTSLSKLNLANNRFSSLFMVNVNDFTNLTELGLDQNEFKFFSFENHFNDYVTGLGSNFKYAPQAKVDGVENQSIAANGSITLTSNDLISSSNSYQWFKDGVAIVGATNKDLIIGNAADTDAGVYHFTATNSVVTGMTLERNPITLSVTAPVNELKVTVNTVELPNSNFDIVSGDITVPGLVSGNTDSETLVNLGADTGEDKIVLINVKPSQNATALHLRFTVNSTGVSNVQVQNGVNWLEFSPEFYRIIDNTIYFVNKKPIQNVPFTLNLINGVQYDSTAGPLRLLVKDGIDLTGATLEILFPVNSGGEGGPILSRLGKGNPIPNTTRSSQIVQPSQTINGFEVDGAFWYPGSYKFILNIQGKSFKGHFLIVQSEGGGGTAEF
ncbi:leucine-rich repeat domain-containing protein [Aquimarina gracilis]|uniref:Leucine-rich repeat domain-containing protein n=1 Tax=Aquimarina gracilis TaxID=874422 RepID=A0ABU5ZVZ9_9FLAO|nr:leucine-rich repeat domain-containing protein [Aquimarina gracilis]MEB3346049.1 leucine-rich repeat domain-containing protein [Aquimarina gracilis]